MAQAKKITIELTPKQLESFLEQFVCTAARKEAKAKLMSFKSSGNAKPSSKPDLKKAGKQKSLTDLKKRPAPELAELAAKKAKKEKTEIPHTGKKPTKKENLAFLTGGETDGSATEGGSTDSGKKTKAGADSKKELEAFRTKINKPAVLGKMTIVQLQAGSKIGGFPKLTASDIKLVAVRMAKLQKEEISAKAKTPTKAEYLAFIQGEEKAEKKGKKDDKGKGKADKKKAKESDVDSEQESPSESDSGSDSESGSESGTSGASSSSDSE